MATQKKKVKDDPEDVFEPEDTSNTLRVSWHDHDDGLRLVINGSWETLIKEEMTDDGLRFTSDSFKQAQEDLKAAMRLAAKNAVNRALQKEWDLLYPKRKQEKEAGLIAGLRDETERERERGRELMARIEALEDNE